MAVIKPGDIIVAHSLLFFLLTKMSIMELDGPSTCPSPWPDIWVQGCSSGLCHPAHVQSQFPCNFHLPFNLQLCSQWRHMTFGEDRFQRHIGVALVFSFHFLFWCCCYLLVCLFLRHDLKLAVSEMLLHIELQASHLENCAHTFVNLV